MALDEANNVGDLMHHPQNQLNVGTYIANLAYISQPNPNPNLGQPNLGKPNLRKPNLRKHNLRKLT
jgi:hypothetical protein